MTHITRLTLWHRHHIDRIGYATGAILGEVEVCRCGRSRQCCGDRWRRRRLEPTTDRTLS
jgi:hypothetical protein